MYISLDWINEIINLKDIKLYKLIDKLTFSGFEVEDVIKLQFNQQEKITLIISATANRSESLSITGIVKEIQALFRKPIIKSQYIQLDDTYQKYFQKIFVSPKKLDNYSVFLTCTLENLTNLTVPNWIRERLICSNLKPTNNLLDFKTYILLETGHPFELYDQTSVV